jgi:molecular chaperone DnaJ
MNLEQAYKTLELPSTASKEEVKKQFKKLAAKYHPDINKAPDAAEKFKQVNAAKEIIENPPPAKEAFWGGGFNRQETPRDIKDIFNDFGFDPFDFVVRQNFSKKAFPRKNITFKELQIQVTLTFEESILGCEKSIEVKKHMMCEECKATGGKLSSDKCTACDGKGNKTSHTNGNLKSYTITDCQTCQGTGAKLISCSNCDSKGTVLTNKSMKVTFKGPLQNGSIIRLQGGGHFHSSFRGFGYGELFINLFVKPDSEMKLQNNEVISQLNISLLEALEGTNREVRTVCGARKIKVKSLTKNNDKVVIPNLNLPGKINHTVILNVEYPTNTDNLIKALKQG